jgi:alpha-glucosidase
MGNHDQPRISSRIGMGQAKVAALLLLTLRGTPTLYYGDEIGMRDVPIPPSEVRDPQGLNMPGKNLSRDPERTPMQWDDTRNSGFTSGEPWLRMDRAFRRRNVAGQENNEYSHLCLYQKLIRLRQQEPSLMTGAYKPVYSDTQLLAYIRQAEGHTGFLIVLNLTHRPCYFTPSTIRFTGVIAVNTFPEQEQVSVTDTLDLFGDEGMIVKLDDWQAVSTNPNNSNAHELSAMP